MHQDYPLNPGVAIPSSKEGTRLSQHGIPPTHATNTLYNDELLMAGRGTNKLLKERNQLHVTGALNFAGGYRVRPEVDNRQVTGTRPAPCSPIAWDKHVTRLAPALRAPTAPTHSPRPGGYNTTSSTVVHHIEQLTYSAVPLVRAPHQPVSSSYLHAPLVSSHPSYTLALFHTLPTHSVHVATHFPCLTISPSALPQPPWGEALLTLSPRLPASPRASRAAHFMAGHTSGPRRQSRQHLRADHLPPPARNYLPWV
ncbi:hypothetical protein E2C01_086917 [Portunus trituberculatus]|uniref:Uncharacterized protein n=1 Tax=Portunus trituberculatus TaxID=210409 RepID=A0A5B7JCP3_PORTR|nr:hypothetical protein [Portunus trituberculatus]